MKKTNSDAISEPRRVVMPVAAAAFLLIATDQRPAAAGRGSLAWSPRDSSPPEEPERTGAGKTRDQASIGTRVKAALLARVGAEAGAIRVASRRGGIVILSGTVRSSTARVRARQIASSVASVRSVTDQLKVKS